MAVVTVGFTGTRQGMSRLQASQLQYVLAVFRHSDQHVRRDSMFVDGNSPDGGADQQARAIAAALGYVTKQEPPDGRSAADMLARNRRIVAQCTVLVAAPLTDKEELRSGTWATVRYARKAGKPVVMLSR